MANGHLPAAIRVLGPAIVGAVMQLTAVAFLTAVFYLLARARYFASGWPLSICAENTSCESAAPLVRVSYLLTAIGVALTNNRFIALTQLWARDASRVTYLQEPRFSAEAVAAQLLVVAIACLVEELEAPTHAATTLGQWIGGIWLGAIIWPAMWSIAAAAIGSLIHALYLAARHSQSREH